MLNQVYVFGYFHADLHPANLFVLPGNGIGYVDFGIVGQLPDGVRESLTRYSWLLFRGEIDDAVARAHALAGADDRRPTRWPPGASSSATTRRSSTTSAARRCRRRGSGGRRAARAAADNPYSKLAVDIMRTTRAHELTLSPSLVAYLKMLVMLGTLRHQLAVEYDLPGDRESFFARLIRQQAIEWLDPRAAMDRLYAGGVRIHRALEFVEYLEAQQPVVPRRSIAVRVPRPAPPGAAPGDAARALDPRRRRRPVLGPGRRT